VSGSGGTDWTEVQREQRPADGDSCQYAWDSDRPVPKEPEK
jgi:hypothetical protein